MRPLIYDTESDGLLDEATKIHCAVTKYEGVITKYPPERIRDFLNDLSTLDGNTIIICHNQIGHDLPLMEKLYGYRHKGIILDTLVLSRVLNPDRVGGHGLGAWGEFLGRGKPTHDDWSTFTPRMLHRCNEDVEINDLTYRYLMKEANLNEQELDKLPSY